MNKVLLLFLSVIATISYSFEIDDFDSAFLQAAQCGMQKDLLFLDRHCHDYSIHALKKVLGGKKVGKVVDVCIHMTEDYFQDDVYEPFSSILIRFPQSSADFLARLLHNAIRETIKKRTENMYGLGEVEWLKE